MTDHSVDTHSIDGMGPSLFAVAQELSDQKRSRLPIDALLIIGRQLKRVVQDHSLSANLMIGTMRFSLFRLYEGHIAQFAPFCQSVTVYGEADVEPPTIPGIEFVALKPGTPLCREWFLVIDSPSFWGSLITRAVADQQTANTRRYLFEAILNCDESIVSSVSQLLSLIQPRPEPESVPRDQLANRTYWARVAYALATHNEANRLALTMSLSAFPEFLAVLNGRTMALERLLSQVTETLHKYCGTHGEIICRYDDQQLYPVTWSRSHQPAPGLSTEHIDHALQQGAPVLAPLTLDDPEQALFPEANAIVVAPLLVNGRTWGALVLGHPDIDSSAASGAVRAIGVAALLEKLLASRNSSAVDLVAPTSPPAPVATITQHFRGEFAAEHRQIVELLEAESHQIVDETVDLILNDPFVQERCPDMDRERVFVETNDNLAALIKAVVYRSLTILDDHTIARRAALIERQGSTSMARSEFSQLWTTITGHMPGELQPILHNYFLSAMQALVYPGLHMHYLIAAHDQLASEMVIASYDAHWDWRTAYQANGRAQVLNDAWWCVDYLIDALGVNNPKVLGLHLRWMRERAVARGLATIHIQQLLQSLTSIVKRRLPSGLAEDVRQMIEMSATFLNYEQETCSTFATSQKDIVTNVAEQLVRQGLASQQEYAAAIAERLLSYLYDCLARSCPDGLYHFNHWLRSWLDVLGLPDEALTWIYTAVERSVRYHLPTDIAQEVNAILQAAQQKAPSGKQVIPQQQAPTFA